MSDLDIGVPSLSSEGIAELPAPVVTDPPAPDAPPAETVEAPKKRRRRRTKAQMRAEAEAQPAQPEPGTTPEDIARLSVAFGAGFAVAGKIMAAARGAHWELTEDETKALGDVWAPALAPYMGAAGQYMPLILAGLTTVGVILPRIAQDNARVRPAPAPSMIPSADSYVVPNAPPAPGVVAAPEPPAPAVSEDGTIPIDPPNKRLQRQKTTPRSAP